MGVDVKVPLLKKCGKRVSAYTHAHTYTHTHIHKHIHRFAEWVVRVCLKHVQLTLDRLRER